MNDLKHGKKLTIAIVLHDIDETVGYKFYLGACERARELGINIYTITQGTRLATQIEPENVNLCFKLAFPKFDGLICRLTPRTSLMS
ncbi:MAG TPA: hypothetical protein VEC37_00070, partial [Bacillota bacterium]|nr:hypothetical protein [Bacillota bacterium]